MCRVIPFPSLPVVSIRPRMEPQPHVPERKRPLSPVHFAEKVRNASDFGKFIPAFEYRLISLRDRNPESLLSYGDALSALFYLANP